jgi:PHD/YefM family antitoxin component YafN of YafNO toxin-antitoxin module
VEIDKWFDVRYNVHLMQTYTITQARTNLFALAEDVLAHNQETLITTKKGNLVVVGEADWRALQETIYLSTNPKYKKSLLAGLKAKREEMAGEAELDW